MKATIVIPVYNGAHTLPEVFKSLEDQPDKHLVTDLIIIDDASRDSSVEVIDAYIQQSSYNAQLIRHTQNKGLAATYNDGFKAASTEFVILMHQDIVLRDAHALQKITEPLVDASVAATYPVLVFSKKKWLQYSFWEKCMLSRFVGKEVSNLTGKFDCFRRSTIQAIGGFDSETYRTAGEDGDIKMRIQRKGPEVKKVDVKVEHIDNPRRAFTLKNYLMKEAQLAEAQGVLLRKYGPQGLISFCAVFFRELLLISLFIPYIQWISLALIVMFSFAYTANVFIATMDRRLVILPAINVSILPIAFFSSLRGFLIKKQVI
jgi:glycosyltransferase involved in cell wall biosynthesis